jgi:hypothetical protein
MLDPSPGAHWISFVSMNTKKPHLGLQSMCRKNDGKGREEHIKYAEQNAGPDIKD